MSRNILRKAIKYLLNEQEKDGVGMEGGVLTICTELGQFYLH